MIRAGLFSTLTGLAVLLGAASGSAWTEGTDESETSATLTGKQIFDSHCALCHGLGGTGDGPLSVSLKTVPADLTQIAINHQGKYPAAKVADVIRNGGGVLGHGSTDMLAWGKFFGERHKPEVGRARIKALVAYIESLQAK
jgi:mono/diheme cytochrome c family protein